MDPKITLTILLITMTPAASAHASQIQCPPGAQFIASANLVVSTNILSQTSDPNLTFFRHVLEFSEQQIEAATHLSILTLPLDWIFQSRFLMM